MRAAWFTGALGLAGCSLLTSLDNLSGGAVAPVDAGTSEASTGADAAPQTDAGRSYADTVRSDSPIAWWRFEETTGTIAHDEIGGHDATYVGEVVLGVPGIAGGRGVSLGGSSRPHVTSSSAAFRFPGRAPFTIEVWVLARSLTDYGRLASTEVPSTSNDRAGWYLGATADGSQLEQEFSSRGSYFRDITWPGTLSATQFQHLAVRYDGATTFIWIDGVPVASRSSTEDAPDVGSLTWGCRLVVDGAINCMDGVLDEAAIYDRALSDDRIIAHHAAGIR